MPPILFVQTRRKHQKALPLLAFLSMEHGLGIEDSQALCSTVQAK